MGWYILASLKANSLLPEAVKQIVIVYEEPTASSAANNPSAANKAENAGSNNNAEVAAETEIELQQQQFKKLLLSYTSNFQGAMTRVAIEREYYGPYADDALAFFTQLKKSLEGDLGLTLLHSINPSEFLQSLFRVFQIVAVSSFSREVYEIAEVCGHLLCCLTLFRPEIYTGLLTSSSSAPRLKDLLLAGVLSKSGNSMVREFFQRIIYFLCENVRDVSASLSQSPLFDLLGGMLDVKIFSPGEECAEACEVLLTSLETYKHILNSVEGTKRAEATGLINPGAKLREVISCIKAYKSLESVDSSEPDKGLLGLLRLAEKLVSIQSCYEGISGALRKEGIEETFFQCLFPLRRTSYEEVYEFKCKSPQSREAAFRLLESLTDFDEASLKFILSDCLIPLPSRIDEISVWDYSPEKSKKSSCGFVGMRNLGCICYMNSMMQQLFLIPPFRNALLSVQDKVSPNVGNPFRIDDNMLHQLQHIFGFLAFSTRQEYNPQRFCFAFKDIDNKPTNTSLQQDAHEFLNILFDRLERSLKPTSYPRLVQSVFGGRICNQLACGQCGTVRRNYEDMYTLSLEIKNQRTFHEAMDKFVANSMVSGYFCEECRNKVEVSKRTLLADLPNVLIVHLQRFSYNYDLGINEKVRCA